MAGNPGLAQRFPYTVRVNRFADGAPPQILQVRRVSLQAVGRISFLFAICLWAVLVLASVLLWTAASATGLLENFEAFWAEATGQESVSLDGSSLFVVALFGGLVLVAATTLLHVMFALLFNSICDLTGGLEVTVESPSAGEPGPGGSPPVTRPGPSNASGDSAGHPRLSSLVSRASNRVSQLAGKWPSQARNR
jgi:hypothetical protein